MKAISTLLISILFAGSLVAQKSAPPAMPRSTQAKRSVPTRPSPQHPAANARLSENISIRLSGTFQGLVPMDLQLTGVGPIFRIDVVTQVAEDGLPPVITSIEFRVTEHKGGFAVDYNLSSLVAIKTSMNHRAPGSPSYNIEFRDVALTGSLLASIGKSITLSKLNGKELTLTLAPAQRPEPGGH